MLLFAMIMLIYLEQQEVGRMDGLAAECNMDCMPVTSDRIDTAHRMRRRKM
jgi:hypothetical protein